MKIIYKANDGTEFTKRNKCEEHEMETLENEYKDFSSLTNRINEMFIESHYETAGECFLINIKELNKMITANIKTVDKSEKFTAGQTILVRRCTMDYWEKKVFVRFDPRAVYPYVCENGEDDIRHWGYAKSI
jgi:predicted RNase H-like nuclease (RuvC/YqgF family)